MTDPISLADASSALRHALRDTVKRFSLWYLLQAALMVIAGVVALFYPLLSSVALVVVLGWVLIISGIVQGISLIGATKVPHFWVQLISAVLSVIIGILFVREPGAAVATLTLLLVVFFMVEGIAKVIFSLTIRPFPRWGWVLLSGVLGIVLAILLLMSPAGAAWLLGLYIGLMLIVEGVALGAMAWAVRKTV